MNLSTWGSLISFFIFFLPGLYLDLRLRKHRQIETESGTSELGRIILGSISITTISFLILFLVREILFKFHIHNFLVDPKALLVNPQEYFISNRMDVIYTFLMELVLSLLLVNPYVNFKVSVETPNFTSVHNWDVVFGNHPVKQFKTSKLLIPLVNWLRPEWRKLKILQIGGKAVKGDIWPVALLTLKTSERVVGFVQMYSLEKYPKDRELILKPVEAKYLEWLPREFQTILQSQGSWERFAVSAEEISTVAIVYLGIPK